MIGMVVNWFAIILWIVCPSCAIAGMAAVLIHDHIKRKRRHKRCYQPIMNWWERKAK